MPRNLMGSGRKQSNMPSVKKGESSGSYMKRCVPTVKKEGAAQKAAVGKCYGMYKSKWKAK
jgi:hypothetical protein